MVKGISILGSTGSIGRQTAQAASRLGIPVHAIAAARNVELLERQARELRPKFAAVYEEKAADELRRRLSDMDIDCETVEQTALETGGRPLLDRLREMEAAVSATNAPAASRPRAQ